MKVKNCKNLSLTQPKTRPIFLELATAKNPLNRYNFLPFIIVTSFIFKRTFSTKTHTNMKMLRKKMLYLSLK